MTEQDGIGRMSASFRHRAQHRLTSIAIGLSLVVGVTLASVVPAFADAGSRASCMGHEASAISPPGSSDEFPGGMPAVKQFIDVEFPGVPPGTIYSTIAKLHEGSHKACDEALE
ncbi:MAG: hypothetical protein GEU73_10505 [Chloroflexi bacterium]|nr:hypothetical protein [Chloroflexota bacterium]